MERWVMLIGVTTGYKLYRLNSSSIRSRFFLRWPGSTGSYRFKPSKKSSRNLLEVYHSLPTLVQRSFTPRTPLLRHRCKVEGWILLPFFSGSISTALAKGTNLSSSGLAIAENLLCAGMAPRLGPAKRIATVANSP